MKPPVEMMQIEEEFDQLLHLYDSGPRRRVLEIGSKEGGTLWGFARGAWPGTKIVSLDLVAPSEHLYASWCPQGVEIAAIQGDSQTPEIAAQIASYGPFDFCFIDAAHDYASVKHDWETYGPMCTGPVAFHDIHHVEGQPETWDNCEVYRVWREIQASGRTTREFIHDYGQQCYGIGVVLP